ncbi:MAG TPA: imidazole glycerol phosphate synthase subunit HisH [Caulobacteraceae bacterium]|jgi:glutamine amidotransferase|nr:imidazole glycerol phosphate synthase subunit HisH [Caulobacteraceae bacterium]
MAVTVVKLGVGNTASMMFALERLGADARLTDDTAAIAEAERLILPGVGAAAHAMGRVEALGLTGVLKTFERPMLGVCLGQQLLYDRSEEGEAPCLGRIEGEVFRMTSAPDRPVPHMGWNQIRRERDDPLLDGVDDGAFVYFVHGYACPVGEATLASTDYGARFSSIVRKNNTWGCQFHPERSSATGARILHNFLELSC